MDAVPSGTGVFYQAMPAVGVDGKKIMKLIPVQMVNGQFVHTEISKARTDSTPQKDSSSSPAPYCTSSLAPKSCQMADDLLRQTFGITANLKICLQRIEEGAAGSVPAEPVESVENQQEPGGGLKGDEPVMPELYKSCENEETDFISGLNNIKRVQEQELSADPATPAPHTDITPVKCFLSQLETNPLCALNNQFLLKGTSCNVETEAVSGYMEPIDEDFPSTDENNSPKSQDTAAQLQARTSVDVNTNTRGRGRTRKRTMCPCCTPGTRDPAVKSSLRLEEPEKRVWMSEQTTKKGTKASRKDGKTSGKISCLLAKNKQKCKAHEVPASLPALCLSAASVDYEELKQEEQIQRPKDLTETEAASEMMTNSMS
uniref:uncharacterized protein LOC109971017 isoform X4 n=1 Tax=Monopterus albus TaxID=43700 RepID=UPI0009B4BD3B|nr:uncharacterized protein LOC109971017 isoform X4 [Monopterus albus]